MSPFPSTKVIPDGWAAHHRPVAEGTMVTPAKFVRTAGPAPYPAPADWTGTIPLWETRVRVQSLAVAAGQGEAAEQTFTLRRYLVTAPVGGPALRVGGNEPDQVHVLGRRLRIVDTAPGSLLWEMDLTCEEVLSQAGPVELEASDAD